MDDKQNAFGKAGAEEAQPDDCADKLELAVLAPADLQALAEKVMALLKRELQLERERLSGR